MGGDREEPASPPRLSRRRFLQVGGVAGGALYATGTGSAGGSQNTHGDGVLADSSTRQSDRVLWRFQTGHWITASPTVVGETVYIGSHDGYQYALDAETGRQEWQFEVGGPVDHAPAVIPAPQSPFEGAAVFCSDPTIFYAIDGGTSESQWRKEVQATSPVLTPDTILFYGAYPQRLRIADGTRKWRSLFLVSGLIIDDGSWYRDTGPPVVVDDQAYIGMTNNARTGSITAVSVQTGQGEWAYKTRSPVRSSPAVQDGRVFAGDIGGTLYAVENAEKVWEHSLSGEMITGSPTVAAGTVFVGSQDENVYAVDTERGEIRWQFETDGGVHSSPTVADGTVFVGSGDGHIYAIDATSGEEVWRFDTGETVRCSPTVVDGVLFVGGWDGNVYALDAGVSGSSEDTRVDQGVLGHHHSSVGADEQQIDPSTGDAAQTPPGGVSDVERIDGFDGDNGGLGLGFGVGTALAGLGAGALWARRRLGRE